MEGLWIVFLALCTSIVASFDLGPIIRIAQCRMQCLRKHSVDGTCDWYSNRGETVCSECWQNCESLETQWEATKSICQGEQYPRCPACQTACLYRKTRVEETYLPSSLPAPKQGPVKLGQHEVAVLLRRSTSGWKESGYYPGSRAPTLRPDTWIIAVVEDGVQHYSWAEWTPTLDSLKEGPLVEATLSWRDVELQLRKQRELEQKRFNDRVRQFYLEKYGERVLFEWRDSQDSPIPEEVFRRFFFRRRNDQTNDRTNDRTDDRTNDRTNDRTSDRTNDRTSDRTNGRTSDRTSDRTNDRTSDRTNDRTSDRTSDRTNDRTNDRTSDTSDSGSVLEREEVVEPEAKESFVVSWEPETGGLMGNQVVDSATAQISLLPGTKYLVRIASNEGPGSFPIEVDTRQSAVRVWRLKKDSTLRSFAVYAAAPLAGVVCGVFIILLVVFLRSLRKGKEVAEEGAEV